MGPAFPTTAYRPFSHAELSGLEKVQNLTRVQHGFCYSRKTVLFNSLTVCGSICVTFCLDLDCLLLR